MCLYFLLWSHFADLLKMQLKWQNLGFMSVGHYLAEQSGKWETCLELCYLFGQFKAWLEDQLLRKLGKIYNCANNHCHLTESLTLESNCLMIWKWNSSLLSAAVFPYETQSTHFDFFWNLFWWKDYCGAQACSRISVTKLAIDQLKPAWSSLTAQPTNAHCKRICSAHIPVQHLTVAQLYSFAQRTLLFWSIAVHCTVIGRRPLRTEAMSRYRWEPQHLHCCEAQPEPQPTTPSAAMLCTMLHRRQMDTKTK